MERLNFEEFKNLYQGKWINYCEVIIDDEGLIIIANPSHTEAMLKLTKRSRDYINNLMPIWASPIHWYVKYLSYVSVWFNFQLLPENINNKQLETLNLLAENNFIKTRRETVINP